MKQYIPAWLLGFSLIASAQERLPSWNEGEVKTDIIEYVQAVTNKKSADFVPKRDRIAVFDNDGTLWSEQPIYFQFLFAFDKVKALAPQHPNWKKTEPFKSVLENNITSLMESGEQGLIDIFNATHVNMDVETFQKEVKAWIKSAKHPTKKRVYSELIFQPMMELIQYLKENGFEVYIVSGLGIDFMRTFIPELYGISESHIIGSSGHVVYKDGKIIKTKDINFINDNDLKPVGIYHSVGKRPIAAFGNSDGDLAMMQYTQASHHKTFQLYVHHTDEKREWAYDKKSPVGRLDKGLIYAKEHNWTIVNMQKEWKVIYPFELNN